MKTRNGFVSNSSSSSFIVNFEEEIKSPEQLKKILFNDSEDFDGPWDCLDATDVSEYIFKELNLLKTKEEILDEFCSDIRIDGEWDEDWKTGWNKTLRVNVQTNWPFKIPKNDYFNFLRREEGKKQYEKLLETLKFVYKVEIEDHDSIGSNIESSDYIFGNHLIRKLSNH